jgi:hypothetical protein
MPAAGPLAAALLLAAVYVFSPAILARQARYPRLWLSLAAGASVSYVFLDVLPELGSHHIEFLAMVGHVPFAEQRIYLAALIGFMTMYALERLLRKVAQPGGTSDAVFWLDLAGYAIYGWVIGDTLVDRHERGPVRLTLYALAMVLHLLIVASSLSHAHGQRYRRARWILGGSVVAGWAAAVTLTLSEVTMARMFAFVAGGILMTSAGEHVREYGSHLLWLLVGALGYGALLLFT